MNNKELQKRYALIDKYCNRYVVEDYKNGKDIKKECLNYIKGEISKMICYICEKDNWHSMDKINPEKELLVCKECGNVAYKINPEEEDEIKQYYKKNYRGKPGAGNLVTTTNKLNYIKLFLREHLKGKKDLIVGDVGAATGYLVDFFKNEMKYKAYGSELTFLFRRMSEWFYGCPLEEELNTKHKYDLITIYHVLEHLIEPDKKLKHYVSLLKDDGHIMISTPEWFESLEEQGGSPMISFEHLFHKDHINVFSKRSLKNLFYKCGLEIVKEDHITYGQTYLLKKNEFFPFRKQKEQFEIENWEEQRDKILKCKEAIEAYKNKRFKEAIKIWPKFPEAWAKRIFLENGKEPQIQSEMFEELLKIMPDNVRVRLSYATWFFMNEQYDKAYKEFDWLMVVKPNEDILSHIGECLNFMGDKVNALKALKTAAFINPCKWFDIMQKVTSIASDLPTWDERATMAAQKELLKKNPIPKPEFKEKL